MSFHGWCACHAIDAKRRADAAYQRVLARRFAREASALYARLFDQLEKTCPWMGPPLL